MTKIYTSLRRAAATLAIAAFFASGLYAGNIDFTDYIANPSFESGFSGWKQSGMQTQTNSTFPLKAGNTYVERWVPSDKGADACSVTQTVTGLIPGDYTMRAAAQNLREGKDDIQTGVCIFAGEKSTQVNVVADYSVDFTVGADGSVEIGYKAEGATGNYLAVDNFRIEYTRYDAAAVATFVDATCSSAEALLASKMDKTSSQALSSAVSALRGAAATGDVEAIAAALGELRSATAAAEASIKAYASLDAAIKALAEAYEEIKGQTGAEEVGTLLAEAREAYAEATMSPADTEALVLSLDNAILLYRVGQSTAPAPEVSTGEYVARGATFALGRSTIKLPSGAKLLEAGFCWSTSENPTVADYRSSKVFNHNGKIYHMTGMKPSTVYYVRAYAITKDYAVGYGQPVKVITIPKGTITYSYTPNDASEAVSARIIAATAEAVDYWNNSTSITGFHVTVNYNSGVNTADCSYGGWVRVGPRENYQRTGTLMHEMNHGVGVGQHTVWYGPDSPYRETGTSGLWLGTRATALVRFLQNDPEAMLHGDGTHMWPYGINGAHEDDGTEILYLANGLMTQAVGEDALPPVAGRFHTPSYAFACQEGVKYYLKVEDAAKGAYTNYLVEGEGNTIAWSALSADKARTDDRAAWYLSFDPVSCYYTLRNAATGNYLALDNSSRNDVITAPEASESIFTHFQFTPSINTVPVAGRNELTYWITVAEEIENPRALAISSKDLPMYTVYRIKSATVARQRWHIVTDSELAAFEDAAGVQNVVCPEAGMFPADVYDLTGRIVKRQASDLDGLRPGFYIVGNRKVFVQ